LNSRSPIDNNTDLKEKQTKALLMIEEMEDEDDVEKDDVDSEEEDESFQEINEDEDGDVEEEMFSMKKRKTKSILPIDKTFSASLFLSLIHRELTFEDLKGMCVCLCGGVGGSMCVCVSVYVCVCVVVCVYVCIYVYTYFCLYFYCKTSFLLFSCYPNFVQPSHQIEYLSSVI
jgi:hypothetical protein